jgi:hypothetical protein
MVNPALGIYSRAELVKPRLCCVERCGNAATVGAWCGRCFEEYSALNAMWAADEAKKADPVYQARRRARVARRWRFVNSFAVMMAVELGIGWSIGAIDLWQNLVLCAAWALLIACLGAWGGIGKAGAAR